MAKPISVDVPTVRRVVIWEIRAVREIDRPKSPSAVAAPAAGADQLLDGRCDVVTETNQDLRASELFLNVVGFWPSCRIVAPDGCFLFDPPPQAIHCRGGLPRGECSASH